MKKRIAAIIAVAALLGAAISVSAASTVPAAGNLKYPINDTRWETTSLGANW